jgi:hypothetical protein
MFKLPVEQLEIIKRLGKLQDVVQQRPQNVLPETQNGKNEGNKRRH